jgi:hypothetical protein
MSSRARGLSRALALAESKQGQAVAAMTRIEAVIADQRALGITALLLGASYECAARIAIDMNDAELFQQYASLAAEQYRARHSSVLGALYERLLEDARKAGLLEGAELDTHALAEAARVATSWSRVTTAMAGCDDHNDRAQRALALLCDAEMNRGHLFLCTRTGLMLAASNTPCQQLNELATFTNSFLESQRAISEHTVTSLDAGVTLDTDTAPGEWEDGEGTRYVAVVLRAKLADGLQIAGIAMLTGLTHAQRAALFPLTTALATKLVESGDFMPA